MIASIPRRSALLAASILCLSFLICPAADPLPDRVALFNESVEGWTTTPGSTVTWQATGGNPGGCLTGTGNNTPWHFSSPPDWAGDWRHYQLLKFDLSIVNREYPDQARNPIVTIHGANDTVLTWTGFSPEFNWTYFEVPLIPAAFGCDDATFAAVMANVTSIRILGEYTTRNETTGLDNVTLTAQAPPPLANTLFSTFTNGTEGWRPIDDVTLVHETAPYDFNLGGKLRGNDWADGRNYWFASPISWAGNWSAFRKLSFAITIASGGGGSINTPNLRIIGANGQELTANLGIPNNGSWTHHAVPLEPATFNTDAETFNAIMAHVIELRIRGEYINGGESELLDNVLLSDGNPRFPLISHDFNTTFDSGPEGWQTYNAIANWSASLGNPGGCLTGTDDNTQIWFFASPDSWAGDWTLVRKLHFQRRYLSGVMGSEVVDAVQLRTFDGRTLTAQLLSQTNLWTPQSIELSPATFNVDRATFASAIRQIERLWIRGESINAGADMCGIDNVKLSLSDAPIVPPDRLTDFETGTEGWRPVGGVAMSWRSSGGNPSGFLGGVDDGSDVWGFGSPEAWCGDWRFYQTLTFDYRILYGAYAFGAPEFVMIHGANGQTLRAAIPSPDNTWKTYQIPLTPASFNTDAATFDAVTSHVVQLVLYAETVSGFDEEAIDNVRLTKASGSYEAWQTLWWPGPERLDPAVSGFNADPDADGIPNGIECITNDNPLVATHSKDPTTTATTDHLVFTFQRDDRTEAYSILLQVESGPNLTDWPDVFTIGDSTANSSPGVEITENGPDPDTIQVSIPRLARTQQFARIKATRMTP